MSGGPTPATGEGTGTVVRRGRARGPGRPGSPEASTGPLVLLGIGGALLLVLAYLVAVRVGLGQGADDWLFEARKAMRLAFRRGSVGGPMAFVVPMVAVAGAGAVVVAVRRQGVVAAGAVGAAMAATVACSTVMKVVLPRPILHDTIWASNDNSYPSGHVAGVLAVVLAWVLVTTPRFRPLAVAVGSVTSAVVVVAVAGSGWHRPSDLAGGVGLALAWACLSGWFVGRRALRRDDRAAPVRSAPDGPALLPAGPMVRWLVTTAALCGMTAVVLVLMRRPTDLPIRSFVGFSVVVLASVVLVTGAVALYAAAVDRATPRPRPAL